MVGGKFTTNLSFRQSTAHIGTRPDGSGGGTITKNYTTGLIWLMPSARFTYYHRPAVRLFSSIGVGLGFQTGGEEGILDFGYDVTLLGVSVGKGHWYGDFELGGLSMARSMAFLSDRWLNISLGYRF